MTGNHESPAFSAQASVPTGPDGVAQGENLVTLYEQTDAPSTLGISSQDFEASFDAFDCEAADDFLVPDGQSWDVERVVVGGFGPLDATMNESVDVRFYDDLNGAPGPSLAEFLAVVPDAGTATGNFGIPLPSTVSLGAGRHWVSVQVNKSFSGSGQWYWRERTLQAGLPGRWRNPADGFGCTGRTFRPDECEVPGARLRSTRWKPCATSSSRDHPEGWCAVSIPSHSLYLSAE